MDWKNLILGTIGVAGAAFTGGASLALTSAAIAAHGAKSAADKQSAAADKAIGVLGPTHQQQINRLTPFITPGQWASQNLGRLMGEPQAPQAPPGAVSGPPVQMRAPDGSVQLVPATLVSHYQQKGATVLNDAASVGQLGQQDQQIRAWLTSKGLPMPTPHPTAPNATSFPMGGQ